jgi:thiosulfate dehydrogenase
MTRLFGILNPRDNPARSAVAPPSGVRAGQQRLRAVGASRVARASILFVLMAAAMVALSALSHVGAGDPPTVDLTTWKSLDIDSVGNDELGKLIKYGYALTKDTANLIGPAVEDPAKRYSGNNLTCESCHLQGGTQPYAMPLVGVWGQFPQYRQREGRVGTLEERINGCMERSMNGRALPLASQEMKAYLAFIKWLSTGIPDGAKLLGAGMLNVKEPGRAADLNHGKLVFAQVCASCHGPDGLGQHAASGAGYQFPPLWGPDSYNNGAGMTRLLVAAAFIKHNMPFGTTYAAPVLSDEDAYDVAAFINSAERPEKAGLANDYPNLLQKPVDSPFGPYADEFSITQHKLGPFDEIRAKVKELRAQSQPSR